MVEAGVAVEQTQPELGQVVGGQQGSGALHDVGKELQRHPRPEATAIGMKTAFSTAGATRPEVTKPTASPSSAKGNDPASSTAADCSQVAKSVSKVPIARAVALIAANTPNATGSAAVTLATSVVATDTGDTCLTRSQPRSRSSATPMPGFRSVTDTTPKVP